MKQRVLFSCLALLLSLCTPRAVAQQPQPCSLAVTSDFESQCLLLDKDSSVIEEPGTIVACQGITVTYTAHAYTGTATVTAWDWEAEGGTLTATGSTATVAWGDGPQGQLTLSVTTDSGTSCFLALNVRLIEKPTVSAATVPAYTEQPGGTKAIYVCQGETVEFTDLSATTNTDIVGHYWESSFYGTTASTPNFRIEHVMNADTVIHRVYNNCGCYDEEAYEIHVLGGEQLDLGCYGTVCQGAEVTYTAVAPSCNDYSWYVEGGTILSGQSEPSVTVVWDSPQEGYGTIGLDGSLCGGSACPTMLTKKIPIIQNDLAIKGQDTACVGEAVIYSVPLYGSTRYRWRVRPSTGVTPYSVNGANRQMVEFGQPGTYRISVSYVCDFLGCGEFTSDTLSVTVLPRLSIVGKERVCASNPCSLTTEPSVVANWEVQDAGNNYQAVHRDTATTLAYTFPHPGKYRVTATHPGYCRPAIFIVTVEDVPPAPTVGDMDPDNPTRVCLGEAVKFTATPSNPDYAIAWVPSCASAAPDTVFGEQVTINYSDTAVCGIHAHYYDRVLGCLSDSHYFHPVVRYTPLPTNLPDTIVVCPGTEILFDSTHVPYEEDMIYRWAIEPYKEYCASVQGDSVNAPNVRILVNLQPTPAAFYMTLARQHCPSTNPNDLTNKHIDTLHFVVKGRDTTSLSILGDSTVCQGDQLTLSGVFRWNSNALDPSKAYWRIEDSETHGSSSVTHTFDNAGNTDVQLSYSDFDYCPNKEYWNTAIRHITVYPVPVINGINMNSDYYRMELDPALDPSDYSFVWSYNGTQTADTGNFMPCQGNGTYSCTVTRRGTACSSSYTYSHSDAGGGGSGGSPSGCDDIGMAIDSFDYCTQELTLSANPHGSNVDWNVDQGNAELVTYASPNNHQATYSLKNLGNYIFHADCGSTPCYQGSIGFTLDFIPDFTVEKRCDTIVIHNNSKYLDSTEMVYLRINSTTDSFPVSQRTYAFGVSPGSYTIELVGFDTHAITGCTIDIVTITDTANTTVTITSPWDSLTCANTAMNLTVSLAPAVPYQYIRWDFGDGSSVQTTADTISHTYGTNPSYTLTVQVVNEHGCVLTATKKIYSIADNLQNGRIEEDNGVYCPYSGAEKAWFTTDAIGYSPYLADSYRWYEDPSTVLCTDAVFYPDITGTYTEWVYNAYHCRVGKKINIAFKNAPTANISTSNEAFCVGEQVTLYGAQSPDTSSCTFQWTVTYNGSSDIPPYLLVTDNPTGATNFFTPPDSGWYTLALTVTADGCPAVGQKSIYVNPKPAAPTITFGSDSCMHNPPVVLIGTTPATSTIRWSNGDVGTTAYYFAPGIAAAWCYDTNTGCRSNDAQIRIEPEPDFDALLTGCYEKCKDYFLGNPTLPVWGLSSGRARIDWDWLFNAASDTTGSLTPPNDSLSLPLPDFGSYNLQLSYNNGNCGPLTSPTLTIEPKATCDCEGIDVTYQILKCDVTNCIIYYDIEVTVCNNSGSNACLTTLAPLFNGASIQLSSTNFTAQALASGGCYTFQMALKALQFVPASTVSFSIYDTCNNCTTDFSVNLMPDDINCATPMPLQSINIRSDLSSNVAAYFDFELNVNPCQELIACWAEPAMVIDYSFNGATLVNGLGMVDFATLTQLVAENGNVCFYAITCHGDSLCKREVCIPAKDIYNMLIEAGVQPASANASESGGGDTTPSAPELEGGLYLMPNPTTGDVTVTGTTDEILEVLVMDVNGRKMETFTATSAFSIATRPAGIYIVRVKTKHQDTEKVTYLKLIKK